MAPKPGWYSDPWGAHKLRRWDGSVWTPQVTDRGPIRDSPIWEGEGTLLTEPVLVVHRWATGGSAAPTLSGTARIYGYRTPARAGRGGRALGRRAGLRLSGGTGSDERWDVSAEEAGLVLSASRTSLELRPVEFTFQRADGSEVGRLVQTLRTTPPSPPTSHGTRSAWCVCAPQRACGGRFATRRARCWRPPAQDWAPTPSGERHVVEVPLRLPPDRAELVVAAAVAIHGEIVRALT